MVAGAERAELSQRLHFLVRAECNRHAMDVMPPMRRSRGFDVSNSNASGAGVGERRDHTVQVVGQVLGDEVGSHRNHAAAKIDANCSGNDGTKRRQHRTNCRALPEMCVGHQRQM